jgi:hypothetical protein
MAANGFIGDFIMGRFYVLELLYQVECIGSRGKNYENIRPFNVCVI